MTILEWLTPPVIVSSLGALIAAITDLRSFRIYNTLTFPLFFSGLIYHCTLSGFSGAIQSLSGALLGIAVLLLPFAMGGLGAGDVKLLAAIGAWLCLPITFYVFVSSAFLSGLCGFAMLTFTQDLSTAIAQVHSIWLRLICIVTDLNHVESFQSVVPREHQRRRVIPYGVMIALGIFTTMIWMNW